MIKSFRSEKEVEDTYYVVKRLDTDRIIREIESYCQLFAVLPKQVDHYIKKFVTCGFEENDYSLEDPEYRYTNKAIEKANCIFKERRYIHNIVLQKYGFESIMYKIDADMT